MTEPRSHWVDDGLTGPPTEADSAWFQQHVVSKGYPKRRDPKPMNGQSKLVFPDGPFSLDLDGPTPRLGTLKAGAIRLNPGIWHIGGDSHPNQTITVTEPGDYAFDGREWVRLPD